MKTINVVTTFLFCVLFVNISSAQTVKKQQTNKERLTKKTRIAQNTRSADFLQDEQHITTLPKVKHLKQEQTVTNRGSGKVKMISPTSIVPHKTKEQSYRPKYHQQREILERTKEVKDE